MENKQDDTLELMHALQQFKQSMKFHRLFEGLKPPEVGVMHQLACAKDIDEYGMNVTELGKALHVTAPSITQIVTQLERDGKVIRTMDPQDRRVVRVRMTKEGEHWLELSRERLLEKLQGLREALGHEKTRLLSDLLSEASTWLAQYNQNDNTIEAPGKE